MPNEPSIYDDIDGDLAEIEAIAEKQEHLRHMTDGRWHDDCFHCLRRRTKGGTGTERRERV